MSAEVQSDRIAAVRHYNRFYTRQIGLLREGLLHSPYSLTEARIIYELGHGRRDGWTAAQLGRELGLDPGYLSRTLARFEERGLLERVRDVTDARQRLLSLTPQGRDAFAVLDRRSHDEITELLGRLSEEDQQRLLAAMRTIEGLLDVGYLDSRRVLQLASLPKSLLILGGGPIGMEFAQMYQRMGVAVTLVESNPRPLPREWITTILPLMDREVARQMQGRPQPVTLA